MTFLAPVWGLLLVPIGLLWWWTRPASRVLWWLRLIGFALLVLALMRPAWKRGIPSGTVVVLADRSASMPADAGARMQEALSQLRRHRNEAHRLELVSFAERATIEHSARQGAPKLEADVGREQSRLATAIEAGLGLVPARESARLVVLSDGRWTGRDPLPAAARAAGAGVPVDFHLMERPPGLDLGIDRVDAPDTVVPGEGFLVNAWLRSPVDTEVRYRLQRGGEVIARGVRDIPAGRSPLLFRDMADEPGLMGYRLTVESDLNDPVAQNNRGRFLVGVEGPKTVLVASARERSGLFELLRRGGLDVEFARSDTVDWSLDTFSRHSAVVLDNVPAGHPGNAGLATLAAWVQHTGSGLFMTGGKNSYGPGGYYRSPLENILPVSMELRREHRKLSLAIVVVLDRSGSMMAPAGMGRSKMDLANLGTAEVFDLLGDDDEIGVIAVDSSAHTVLDINRKAALGGARNKILRIESMGGGIFVYEGLEAAGKMMTRATAGTRHIILFADAADAEQPGKYETLLKKFGHAGITVSVIGLGTDKDVDAALLRDVARRGNGECYFSSDPTELPRLFAQDTFTVARSTFINEPTAFSFTPSFRSVNDQLGQPPGLGGYNLTYHRPQANLDAFTGDEYEAPVVAHWFAGAGRVICYTGEADGEFARPMADWDQAGSFYSSLARWAAGDRRDLPDGLLLTHGVQNGNLVVDLHLDPERARDPFADPPGVTLLRGRAGGTPSEQSRRLRWIGADRLRLEEPLDGQESVLATIDIPGFRKVPLSPVCLPYAEEYRPRQAGEGRRALRALAQASGGMQRLDLAGVWDDLPASPRWLELRLWFIVAAIVVILVEILERRTGVLARGLPTSSRPRPATEPEPAAKPIQPKRRKQARRTPAPRPEAAPTPGTRPAAAPQQARKGSGTLSALKAARKRADDRTRR